MSAPILESTKILLDQAKEKFKSSFGRDPVVAASAPGRVNLIGEHVDYCEGFVLPVALPLVTIVVGGPNGLEECNVLSILQTGEELKTTFLTPAAAPLRPGAPEWANYVKGVVANFPGPVNGFDVVVMSNLPMGSGLSSSSSIEVAVFTFLEALSGTSVSLVEKARLCQKAEHEFPGMPCGIMDQYIATMARKDHALLIDCRSLESIQIPMKTDDTVILVVNSNVKHKLTGSEYPQRRQQCQEAAKRIGILSLRSATSEDVEELKKQDCDELVIKRAKHVVEEIARTEETAKRLSQEDYETVGKLFYESHTSMRDLMEVSCPEIDQLVDITRGAPGVYGARMTGGGFGGCIVALIKTEAVDALKKRILTQYKGKPEFIVCQPSEGARAYKL